MPFDKLEQLPDLVGLGLSVYLLEVQELRNAWVNEDVMAAADAADSKAERFSESAGICESKVVGGGERLLK